MTVSFTTPDDLWHGGYYELAIQLGHRSDERLSRAVAAIWNYPLVKGCYARRDLNPEDQQTIPISEAAHYQLTLGMHLYGIAHIPDNANLVCGSVAIREEESEIDWLDFYIPADAADDALHVNAWKPDRSDQEFGQWQTIEAWFADLGRYLFEQVPFTLALIGWEVSGMEYAEDIAQSGIPTIRYGGYLWPESQGLAFYRTTK